MPNDCAPFDQAGNPKGPASMPGSALGDKDGSSRRDKDWAARPPGNIKSKPTNPAILTTYEGMHHDAVSSIIHIEGILIDGGNLRWSGRARSGRLRLGDCSQHARAHSSIERP